MDVCSPTDPSKLGWTRLPGGQEEVRLGGGA